MTTKVLRREFTIKDPVPLVADSAACSAVSDNRWSTFLQTYGVWPTKGTNKETIIRSFYADYTGTYYFRASCDDSITLYVDGKVVNAVTADIFHNPARGVPVTLDEGVHTLRMDIQNGPGVRGAAVTIQDSNDSSLLWDTRTYAAGSVLPTAAGRFTVTMPFRAKITAYAWGGGGGSGGLPPEGGYGSPGLYNTTSFTVNRGDALEVFVGHGGGLAPTIPNVGGTAGGTPGKSIININNDSAKSFNGGTGGTAGSGGWSGGGGGGGGASGVLVNNVPVLVAGGGGGGGGGGNYKTGTNTRPGTITNNATGAYNPGALAIDLTKSSTFTLSAAGSQVNNYTTYSPLTTPTVGTTVAVFGWGFIPSGQQIRTLTSNSKVHLASASVLTFYVNRGTEKDWGQTPDKGEPLTLQYSIDGTNWTSLIDASVSVKEYPNTWLTRSVLIPDAAKVVGGVYLRFYQKTSGDAHTKRDTWAFTSLWSSSPVLDFRGENGQNKAGVSGKPDGGGAGAGGGGYPGGQGGIWPSTADVPGLAGQCGGNFPAADPTIGSDSPYYDSNYSGGGVNDNGKNGKVVLLIEPLGLCSVKENNSWKQVAEAFVKVNNAWKNIDTVYVKVNDTWKQVSGTGIRDITLTKTSTSYGTSNRSYS